MTTAMDPSEHLPTLDADDSALARWFLTAEERGNPATEIDRRHGDGRAWTRGNRVQVLIDGTEYFPRLYEQLCSTQPGDTVYFTGLEGDADERLAGPGTEIGRVLCDTARAGIRIRGLLWRAHPKLGSDAEVDNLLLSKALNEAGGQVLLDNRIRRGGSHHQKIVVIQPEHPEMPSTAFVGGIDLAHGRHDDHRHRGDQQPAELDDSNYGPHPGWHDVHIQIHGPATDDVAFSFRERWQDPTPLDHRNPLRAAFHRLARHPMKRDPLPDGRREEAHYGTHAVQLLRTYPARRRAYPFAPEGERSIARAYAKAFSQARHLIYLEDQYLWSLDATRLLCEALRREPELRLVVVIPRFPDPAGRLVGGASRFGRQRVISELNAAGGDRVAIYDLENTDRRPVYVHSKVCIVDDFWMTVGSDNLNRRSWTHDSEIACAIIDEATDPRGSNPLGSSDTARKLARETRLRLAAEHLGLEGPAYELVDPSAWFAALQTSARALDAWHADGCNGVRPAGHLRAHPMDTASPASRPLLHLVHAGLLDPDGRPRKQRRRDSY